MRTLRPWVLLVSICIPCLTSQVSGQSGLTQVASGFNDPLFVTHAPGDSDRLFILEQGTGSTGRIRMMDMSSGTVSNYMSVPGIQTGGERGLLGLAFHPDFANNGHFYVNVTSAGRTQIRRYTATGDPLTSTSASSGTRQDVTSFPQPFSNHNGGWIGFDPTSSNPYLYIATGDGGSGGDPQNNSQDITNNRLGKMLRIDVDGDDFPSNNSLNYAVPPSNPFVGVTGDDDIWSYGLRNPFRNSFDRKTGDLWIGDVGQNIQEEINVQPSTSTGGENYGWRVLEGDRCFDNSGAGGNPNCNDPGFTDPIYTYRHNGGSFGGFSVTGGYVYRGSVDRFEGEYFFADFVTNNVWSLDPLAQDPADTVVRRNPQLPTNVSSFSGVSSFGEDADGEMYLVSYSNGRIFQFTSSAEDAIWNGDSAVGTPGDGTSWSSASNWTRGGTADSAFVPQDTVVFAAGSSLPVVNLGSNRVVSAARFESSYKLVGGNLQVLSGNIDVAAGVVAALNGDLLAETSNRTIRKHGAGTFNMNGSSGQAVVFDGLLGGNGTFTHVTVLSGGGIGPGDGTGKLTVTNNVTMEAGTRFRAELGGTAVGDYDQLEVIGEMILDGTLEIVDVDGFGPTVRGSRDSFALIEGGALSGLFDDATYNGATLVPLDEVGPDGSFTAHSGDGLFQTLSYGSDNVTLDHYYALPGDANGDGDVDVSDFNIWNANKFTEGTDWLSGDFNGDGRTDVADFNLWNANKFTSAAAPVPEPSALALLMIGMLGLVRRRANRG